MKENLEDELMVLILSFGLREKVMIIKGISYHQYRTTGQPSHQCALYAVGCCPNIVTGSNSHEMDSGQLTAIFNVVQMQSTDSA